VRKRKSKKTFECLCVCKFNLHLIYVQSMRNLRQRFSNRK